jgi:hypothetical protein
MYNNFSNKGRTVIVRTDQFEALSQDAKKRFLDEMMTHFARLWPSRVEALGAGYRDWLTRAVEAAASFGLFSQNPVARYINLWFVWGAEFEKQPGFEWAFEILNDPKRSEWAKAHQLAHRTRDELEERVAH